MESVDLKKFFIENFTEGNRFNLINRFAGSCAVLGVPLEECLAFYRQFKYLDDENREKLIIRTYEKYEDGVMLQTLKEYNVNVKKYFKKSIITNEDYGGKLDKLMFYRKYENDIIDLNSISKPINKFNDMLYYLYLRNRGIEEKYIFNHCRAGIGKYINRVIFPIYNKNNECIFFTARAIMNNITPKYLNSITKRDNVIWNYYNSDFNKPVIVTEGIINAIISMQYTGVQSIATLSKNITFKQIKMLSLYPLIYLVFDGDVSNYYLDKIRNKINTKVIIVKMPYGKDVNDLTKEEFISIFDNAVNNNKEEMDARILFR